MPETLEFVPEKHLSRFGLSEFRPGQREVISAVMSGKDCLCVMPTGGGKSLCYQLPAVAREGMTLVVSPLIALMQDQVQQLERLGVAATFINSTLDAASQNERLLRMAGGEYDLVYVAAERFRSPRFREAVRRTKVQLLAIDEAHCISQWGHDFRPDYARLGLARSQLGHPTTIALTATATRAVRKDIVAQLELPAPETFITGFARPNLFYEVQTHQRNYDKDESLVKFLRESSGTGIIYVATRKRCGELAEMITSRTNRRAAVYHAGLVHQERQAAQDAFMQGRVDVVVCTNAFGMGIDKANVRYVVHYNLPGTLEAYYQEAGRAGRDGEPSRCLLLYASIDTRIQEYFIESAYPEPETVQKVCDFLRRYDEDPIQLTQQELKDLLNLPVGTDGVRTCEQLLEKAGVIERLEPSQNMAVVRITSGLPTLVDMLPKQASVQRKVLHVIEQYVGPRRQELVYFHPRDLAGGLGIDYPAFSRALYELRNLKDFEYVPPFRGRAIHVLDRDTPFAKLQIDFDTLQQRKQLEYEKLELVSRFARSHDCRQQIILDYFGQSDNPECGHCDNCDPRTRQETSVHQSDPAVLQAVRMALSGVARARGRFGKHLIAQMLGGSTSAKVTNFRLHRLSTYGLLKDLRNEDTLELIDALLEARCLEQIDIERFRPLLKLTDYGSRVMRSQEPLNGRFVLKEELVAALRESYRQSMENAPAEEEESPTETEDGQPDAPDGEEAVLESIESGGPEDPLLEQLRQWRRETAATDGVPAYRVLTNAVLEQIVQLRPDSLGSLLEIKGVGASTVHRYGESLLALLAGGEVEPAAGEAEPPEERPEEITAAAAPASSPDPASQPPHYWTWRLLTAGFTPDECAAIRALDGDVIFDHALRAAEAGLSVQPGWFLSQQQLDAFERIIGEQQPQRIRPLLPKLPRGTRYEEVQLFLKCRIQARSASE